MIEQDGAAEGAGQSAAPILVHARQSDVDEALRCLVAAFATDPLMNYFFHSDPRGVVAATEAFFSVLLRARLALGMPALVLRTASEVRGLVMGYDTSRPDWPADFEREWTDLESRTPGIVERFDAYERVASASRPTSPHYYLGVIGVDPVSQGRGAGSTLLDAFCRRSAADPLSSGVYLETASPASLAFYRARGFVVCGEGDLDGLPLWCVFRRDDSPRASEGSGR